MVDAQTGAGSKPWNRIADGGSISRGGVRGSREAYSNEGRGIDEYDAGDDEGVGGNGTERNGVFRRRMGPRGSERSSTGSWDKSATSQGFGWGAGASRIETQGKRSKTPEPCGSSPRGQSCRRDRREEREPVGGHFRFLVMLQEHDLDTSNPASGGCMRELCGVEIQIGGAGEFDVLQSENGDKSTGDVCSSSSGKKTRHRWLKNTYLHVRELEGGGAKPLGSCWERHGWRDGKRGVWRVGDDKYRPQRSNARYVKRGRGMQSGSARLPDGSKSEGDIYV